jgi:hypothetical protein
MYKRYERAPITDLALLLAGTVAILCFAWVGYLDSDDKNHLSGAFGWYYHAPYLAVDHAEFRHFIALPIALCFKLFGVREFSVVLPTLLCFLALMVFSYSYVCSYFGRAVAATSSALILCLPVFAIRATVAYSDIVELIFIAVSFWLFWSSTQTEARTWRLLVAGGAAGAAWLTRETTFSLLLLYGILFLMGYGIRRPQYWIMAVGFFAVASLDMGYYAWQTGDPLYRYWSILDAQVAISDHGLANNGEVFDKSGNVRLLPVVDRLFVLLINHEFALFYFFAIPALWWAWRNNTLPAGERDLARALVGLTLLWYLFVAIVLKNQHPRYYSVTTYSAAILMALWCQRHLIPRYGRLGIAALGLVLASGLLGIYVDNKNSLFGERALVAYVEESGDTVYTDPTTHRRTRMLLRFEGLEDRVISDRVPPAGALFYNNPNRIEEARSRAQGTYELEPQWQQVLVIDSGRKLSGRLIELLGLQEVLPNGVYRRLNKPNKDVALYQVSAASE